MKKKVITDMLIVKKNLIIKDYKKYIFMPPHDINIMKRRKHDTAARIK